MIIIFDREEDKLVKSHGGWYDHVFLDSFTYQNCRYAVSSTEDMVSFPNRMESGTCAVPNFNWCMLILLVPYICISMSEVTLTRFVRCLWSLWEVHQWWSRVSHELDSVLDAGRDRVCCRTLQLFFERTKLSVEFASLCISFNGIPILSFKNISPHTVTNDDKDVHLLYIDTFTCKLWIVILYIVWAMAQCTDSLRWNQLS